MATFPSFDLSRFDLSKVSIPAIDLPKVSMPDVKLPNLPDLPKLPNVELPDTSRVTDFARDAAYVGVGLAVLGIQQAQVRRRDVVDTVRNGVDYVRDALI